MTEIIHVSPDASFEAVRRQIGQIRAERLALVLPDGWTDLDNLARMRLLQRQAQVQRSELALVTRDEPTRQAAKQAGIPVFYHVQDVDKRNWKMNPLLPLVDPQHPDAGLPEAPAWRRGDLVNQESRPTRFKARQQRIQAEDRYRRPLPVWMQWISPIFIGSMIGLLLFFFLLYILPAATITLVPGRDVINRDRPTDGRRQHRRARLRGSDHSRPPAGDNHRGIRHDCHYRIAAEGDREFGRPGGLQQPGQRCGPDSRRHGGNHEFGHAG